MSGCDDCRLPAKPHTNDGGRGETLCKPCAELIGGDPSVRVFPLGSSDLELVLAWRANPRVYSHFRQQNGPIEWEEHIAWFESRDSDRYDFVINYGGRRVGVVNIDAKNEVGIFLGDFSAQGHGVATATLSWLCERFEERSPLYASIQEENEPSKRLFGTCGFQQCGRDGEWIQYVYGP